ncbi:MAG TPA: aminoglycoside phosphotransferase [Streptosporangiaceae bacterium]
MTTRRADPGDSERAEYLREVCALLWPAPARTVLTSSRAEPAGPGDSELIVLPGLRRPRLVVPHERKASAAAVIGYGKPVSAVSKVAARTLAVALASGLGSALLRDRLLVRVPAGGQTIEAYLSDVLGQRITISMHLGAARANRKPVLQLLTAAGDTVGYAKIGVSPLTADLVRAEHAALTRLAAASFTRIELPRVLDYGDWRGLAVLVLTPLPVRRRRVPVRPARLAPAMAELAGSDGLRAAPLAASEYWRELGTRLDGLPGGPDADALRTALGKLASRAGGTELCFGSWHGDWTPWNMASTAGGLLVWDFERFAAGVPVGFDALHYWLQEQVVPGRRDPAATAAQSVRRAPALLEPFGVAPPCARLTALVYLAELSVRYLADRQEHAGARLGAPRRWLIPALTAGASQL